MRARDHLNLLLAAAASCAVAMPAAAAPAAKLQAHRAIYDMSLAGSSSSAFSDGFGRVVIEMSDACDGFVVSQRQRVELITREGASLPSDVNGSTWEAKDGRVYRFSVERLEGPEAPSREVGRASREPDGQGLASYREPPGQEEVVLPDGTLFPTAHLAATLEAAQEGRTFFAAPLFDGYEPKVYDVSAAIAPAGPDAADEGYPFAALPVWNVRFAFYDPDSREAVPNYEIGLRLYANGVASRVSFDYGEFRLDGRLSDYTALPAASCD